MKDQDYGRCISACSQKSFLGIDHGWCAVCQIERLKARIADKDAALVQARGALRLDAMVQDSGEAYGTTDEALHAISVALGERPY